jgi:SM-20-related protein
LRHIVLYRYTERPAPRRHGILETRVNAAALPATPSPLPLPEVAAIAGDLRERGFAICPDALPASLSEALRSHLAGMPAQRFRPAGIGRQQDHTRSERVRRDAICWITGESSAGAEWLAWAAALQAALNRELLLGLFSFESHFAHYRPGDFYRRHVDAFRGEANRVLSLVAYLNPGWRAQDGGELLLYPEDGDSVRVLPELGTCVLFLSEEMPHEVLPARRDRHSIAGWFRVNGSTGTRVDPPR